MTNRASSTVYLIDDDQVSRQIGEIASQWSACGLLQPTLWLSAAACERAKGDLESLLASHCVNGRVSDAPLLQLLGRSPISLLRLVIINVVGDAGAANPRLVSLGDEVAAKFASYLPAATKLRIVNVIVPSGQVTSLPGTLLLQSGVASVLNVIVSPEDRVGDAYINVGVGSGADSNLVGHAALAALTVAGGWSGMEAGPFDDETKLASVAGDHIIVARAFAGSVQVEPIIDLVTQAALETRDDWPIPDYASPTGPISALDAPRLVDRMVDQCSDLEGGAFKYRPFVPTPPDEPRTIGLLRAFIELFRFVTWRVRHLHADLGERVHAVAASKAEAGAQALIFGQDSGAQVRVGGLARPEVAPTTDSVIADANRVLEVTGRITEVYAPPTPSIWRSLRGLVFGLLDGSSLPADFEEPLAGGRRQVVTRPALLGPDPFDAEGARVAKLINAALKSSNVVLSPGDPYSAKLAEEALLARLAERQREGGADSDVEKLDEALGALRAWTERQSSLLWRLADKVAGQLQRARGGLNDALAGLRSRNDEADGRLPAAWRKCRRRWIILGVVATALEVLIGFSSVTLPSKVGAMAGVVVGAYVLMVLAFAMYAKVEFAVLNARERDHHRLTSALDGAVHNAEEVARLGSLYRQLVAWSEIIGAVLHRPWGTPSVTAAAEVAAPLKRGVAAASFAAGRSSDAQRVSLINEVSNSIFTRGWISEVYGRIQQAALATLAEKKALPVAPDPDIDTPQAGNGALTHLQEEIADGMYGQVAVRIGRAKVADFCGTCPPSRLVSEVDQTADDGGSVTIDEFMGRLIPSDEARLLAGDIWTEAARAARSHEVGAIEIWGPGIAEPLVVDPKVRWFPLRDVELPGGGLGIKAIRLDLSEPCSRESLRIIDAVEERRPGRSDDDDQDGD